MLFSFVSFDRHVEQFCLGPENRFSFHVGVVTVLVNEALRSVVTWLCGRRFFSIGLTVFGEGYLQKDIVKWKKMHFS